jgi:hypothetical protein
VVKTSVDTCLSRTGLLSVGEASGAKTGGRNTIFFVSLFLEGDRKNKKPFSFSNAMAKRTGMKIQPAITDLYFTSKTAADAQDYYYVDTAKELSKVNRRMYEQGRMYAYQGLTFIWRADAAQNLASLEVTVRTAGNTWVVHNSFVKGKALWDEMQDLVLEDNPSIKGKWHQFITRLDDSMTTSRILKTKDGSGTDVLEGEWSISTYVMPQHDVTLDPATGESTPLPAEEITTCLIGPDNAGSNIKSLVKAYQESRSTVSPDQPNVPAGMSTSFFNLLTDSGSQEPELADVIERENDNPPYDITEYYGGSATGMDAPAPVAYVVISASEVDGRVGPFVAPCGLIQIEVAGYDNTGTRLDKTVLPAIDLLLHVAPGTYKGVAAIPMGQ